MRDHTQAVSERDELHMASTDAMTAFYKDGNTLEVLVKKSYGYAIFPSIVKGAFVVGGANGRGEVYEQGAQVGWTVRVNGGLMAEASVGEQKFSYSPMNASRRLKPS